MAREVEYSEEYVRVPNEWLDRYYRVTKPNEEGRYFLVGPCPRCRDELQSPLGELPRKRWYQRKKPIADEVKRTVVICGCGRRHAASEQEIKYGCGTRWRFDLTVRFSQIQDGSA